MQLAIVFAILAAAVAYAAWRIYYALRHGGSPCRGCKLADACGKRGRRSCESRAEKVAR